MKVSEKKKQAGYEAISTPIMDLRVVALRQDKKIDPLELDGMLFKLELKIWEGVKTALNIEGL